MQKKNAIKVNQNSNFSFKIPKSVQKSNKILKSNLTPKIIKNNISIENTPKNVKVQSFFSNTKNLKENNQQEKILKAPNSLRYSNYSKKIKNTPNLSLTDENPKNLKKNNLLKYSKVIKEIKSPNILTKDKQNTKIPNSKDIIPKKNNASKKVEFNNSKIMNNPNDIKYKSSIKISDNKKENKNMLYSKRKINNLLSKKSSEKKMSKYKKIYDDKKLNNLTTFEKIIILQNLLKEIISIKERFEDNKNKMTEKIYLNCYNYFNDKVYMKEIFDYCISKKPEEHKDYQLISIIQDYLDYNIYKSLYDFYFLIRNDNNLMLKIINLSTKYVYEELSDFLVNFCYENVINSSFIQEELIMMIYLLLENLFLKIIPDNFNNINNIYITYINNHFLFYVFKCLTRKIDVRNYLYSILNDIIFRLESFRIPLSVDINVANRFLRRHNHLHHSFIKFAKGDNDNTKVKKTKIFLKNNIKNNIAYNLGIGDKGSVFLKRTKKIELGSSNNSHKKLDDSWLIIHSKLSQSRSLNDSNLNNSINNSILNKSKAELNTEINEEKKILVI